MSHRIFTYCKYVFSLDTGGPTCFSRLVNVHADSIARSLTGPLVRCRLRSRTQVLQYVTSSLGGASCLDSLNCNRVSYSSFQRTPCRNRSTVLTTRCTGNLVNNDLGKSDRHGHREPKCRVRLQLLHLSPPALIRRLVKCAKAAVPYKA